MRYKMKKISLVFLLILNFTVFAQDGVQIGLNVSPGFKVNMSKQKGTGLRNNSTGYGFNVGIPVKFWMREFTAFNTGINFDHAAFDSYLNGVLVSSFRINAVDVPLAFNLHMNGRYYGILGGGVVYNLRVTDLNAVQSAVITDFTNLIQPYITVGINNLVEKDFGFLEIGVQGRYQLLDIWKSSYTPYENFNSHLISLDLLLRYYF